MLFDCLEPDVLLNKPKGNVFCDTKIQNMCFGCLELDILTNESEGN